MSETIRADQVAAGDHIELWNGNRYRVTEVLPSASGKVINLRAVVERSVDPALAIG